MRRRPWILVILALGHFFAPFLNLIFDAVWAGIPVSKYIQLFFQPQNFSRHWFHFFAPMTAGLAIYLCRRWSYWVYVALIATLALLSFSSYLTRTDLHNPWPLVSAYFVNFLIVTYFLLPAVRKVYFDPRLRWWEMMPRYQVVFPCTFSLTDSDKQSSLQGQVTNFSQTGLFLKTSESPPDHALIQVHFPYQNGDYQFQGKIVHHQRQKLDGFGVQFLHDPRSRKAAKTLADLFHSQGLLQPERTLIQEDTFGWWLRQLFSSGKGLLPTTKK